MNEELEVLEIIAQKLDSQNISYMVTGSIAMNFYANPRMTRDIDIIIEISTTDITILTDIFSTEFYLNQEAISEAIQHQSMFNIIHNEYILKVDFIIRKNEPYRIEEFKRRRQVEINATSLWIVAPEDLVLSKLWWAKDSRSEMQINDAKNIVQCVADIDVEYIKHWAGELGLTTLYREIQGERHN